MYFNAVNDAVQSFTRTTISYLPNFFGGLIIFAIGLILAQIVRKLLTSIFGFFKLGMLIKRTNLAKEKEVKIWEDILIELISWAVVILFLIPTAEVWGLTRVTVVLNQLLFYLPNVFVAVVVAFIGLIMANLISDLVRQGSRTAGSASSNTLGAIAQYAIIFFTALVVLNQLGIAQDLIRILFTGIVAMIAIAGGLAFGLGGQTVAKEMLEEFRKSVK
jgi:hypothetical protein